VGEAITKALLVAMFFMHLRFEKMTLALIATTPLILCAFLAMMLLPDSKHDAGAVMPAAPAGAAAPAEAGGGEGAGGTDAGATSAGGTSAGDTETPPTGKTETPPPESH
jgi:hypothetical protein